MAIKLNSIYLPRTCFPTKCQVSCPGGWHWRCQQPAVKVGGCLGISGSTSVPLGYGSYLIEKNDITASLIFKKCVQYMFDVIINLAMLQGDSSQPPTAVPKIAVSTRGGFILI